MGSGRLQHQRYELKYHVNEGKAFRIRDFVRDYLEIDEYSALQADRSYPTLSLYLDSDGLETYWCAINGDRNRFKLRLRYYDDEPDTPVFFEIKRREDNVIRSEEHTSELQSLTNLVCRLLLEKKKSRASISLHISY